MGKILQIGEELDGGRLEVVGQLKSSGQYAEIYQVRKKRVPLECLLKVNLPHDMLDKDAVAESAYEYSKEDHIVRTDREARMLMRFNHPHIAHVEDVISIKTEYKGILFQPISGARTLRELISEEKHKNKRCEEVRYFIRAKKLITILKNLTGAIDYMHNSKTPIVHRDIRPENIVIDAFNQAFLIDFGTACKDSKLDGKWGSLKYAPPEFYDGKTNIYSDFWSLGLCLYEFLTSEHPVDNSSNLKARRSRIIEKVRSLNQEDAATKFSENLLEKLSKIKNYVQELNSKTKSSFSFKLHVADLMPSIRVPFKIDEVEFEKNLADIMCYCMPSYVSRRLLRNSMVNGLKHFKYLIHRPSDEDQYRAREIVERILKQIQGAK